MTCFFMMADAVQTYLGFPACWHNFAGSDLCHHGCLVLIVVILIRLRRDSLLYFHRLKSDRPN